MASPQRKEQPPSCRQHRSLQRAPGGFTVTPYQGSGRRGNPQTPSQRPRPQSPTASCCRGSCSAASHSLRPHGLQPATPLFPWDSPGKNTGVDCHVVLQGIFPTQGSNSHLLHCREILYRLSHQGSPFCCQQSHKDGNAEAGATASPPPLPHRNRVTVTGRVEMELTASGREVGRTLSPLWPPE